MAKPKRGLGKGLEALFAENDTADINISTLAISEIEPGESQPRTDFSPEALTALSQSIKEHGVLQPIVVRPLPSGRYQIVAGERRWRASRMAGITEVPVIVRELSDMQSLEVALVENLMREDLNCIEEAMGYRTLMEKFSLTQEQISLRVGKSRSAVANALRLLTLPQEIIESLQDKKLTAGHARALLVLPEQNMSAAARQVISKGLSVRATEALAKKMRSPQPEAKIRNMPNAVFVREMEIALRQQLSRRVRIITKDGEKGKISLEFYSLDDLKDIGAKLTKE